MADLVIEVVTDLDPERLNAVGLEIFRKWIEFAMGGGMLGGRRIMHPTGRYASSIRYKRYGQAHVAIIADESVAPEALILEIGHGPIDLLTKLAAGRTYPIHRGAQGAYLGGGARGKRMWAQARAAGFSGFATTPTSIADRGPANTSGTGPAWTIPAMPAYSPAHILAELVRQEHGARAKP
jgi:hypothetical protein